MNVPGIIERKRKGEELSGDEIRDLIRGFHQRTVEDHQISAFAMAVLWRGLNSRETMAMTRAMLEPGDKLQWPAGRPVVDKHSTGGVGDKISLPLAPILAELGLRVPMLSGRSLGKTGGTIDKLESIPGFRTSLELEEIRQQVEEVGCVITGATGQLAPVDQRLYAIRDVTATVPSPALITSSILNKKLSEGLDCLLLDVKWGTGAFMESYEEAEGLAELLVATAGALGVRTVAMLTDMNRPLGRWIGNSVEIDETLEILQGIGPDDTTELTVAQAARLAMVSGVAPNEAAARDSIREIIRSGRGLERFERMVTAQGGNLSVSRPRHRTCQPWLADRDGYFAVHRCGALGTALNWMRGGRFHRDDKIDHGSAIEVLVQPGDRVARGQPLLNIWYDGPVEGPLRDALVEAVRVVEQPPPEHALIVRILDSSPSA